MIKHLLQRPISVFMAFLAIFILGMIAYVNVPVSLLPDIAIPEISVHITGQNSSARELENTVVQPVRQQLLQVGKLRDIRSETRDESAVIHLSFEYGANTDLAFIEVNEKVDAAMNYLPHDIQRPRVIKASATDIPVFNLDLTLRSDTPYEPTDVERFVELSEFAESVIKRRFEQLPQVAMVDISGLMQRQILIYPDAAMLETSGITHGDIEAALNNNNVDPGNMVIRDGYYEYIIRFSSILRTPEDIENIYIRKNDRIYQLKDFARVELAAARETGSVLHNGKRALVLSVIKQSDEGMSSMQSAMDKVVDQFRLDFPEIEFSITQSQTELLDYSISNLIENLILAFIFVFLVSVIFMRDGRSSFVIGLTLFVSLVITLLFFYLFGISLNVVSLTGLILAAGMMIDNSIIVTDNIGQYRQMGYGMDEACYIGTKEVVAPMLSSVLTTISIFMPLVFLSGMAGAIFFDQAFSVTVGLLVSYITGITLLPILYRAVFSIKLPRVLMRRKLTEEEQARPSVTERIYDRGIEWIFSHKALTTVIMLAVLPVCFLFFKIIPKEKMPHISQNEVLVNVEWGENIHIGENYDRCVAILKHLEGAYVDASTLVGQQQFMVSRDDDLSATEAEMYLKTVSPKDIPALTRNVKSYIESKYPSAAVTFKPAGTIFEKIFTTGEAELVVEYYPRNVGSITPANVQDIEARLTQQTGVVPVSVSFQDQLNIEIDRELMQLYNVDQNNIYRALRTAFRENKFATLRSQQYYLPIVLGESDKSVEQILNTTMINLPDDDQGIPYSVPLSTFVKIRPGEDIKTIVAGKAGEYLPFNYYEIDKPEQIVNIVKSDISPGWDVGFSGGFFSNRKMINEMAIILLISIMLMYFILAAQFENFVLPLVVLLEIPIDITAALGLLIILGHSLNLMSAIGIVVTCGIIINDSILKVDIMNQLRKSGMPLMEAIHEAGRRRLKAIIMTSLTSIVCMAPLLYGSDLGSELEKPLAIATIGGMLIGTPVSIFVVPLVYWRIYRKHENKEQKI